jgi:hypothetical protein
VQWLLVGVVAWAVLWGRTSSSTRRRSCGALLPRPYVDGLLFLRGTTPCRRTATIGQSGRRAVVVLARQPVGGLTTPVLLVLVLALLCWRLRARCRDACRARRPALTCSWS